MKRTQLGAQWLRNALYLALVPLIVSCLSSRTSSLRQDRTRTESSGENYSSKELIADLTSGRELRYALPISDGPILPPALAESVAQNQVEEFFHGQGKRKLDLSKEVLNAASESAEGRVWAFDENGLDSFFKDLFLTIHRQSPHKVDLSPKDLFHGHIFVFEDNLGILFHAKEYPNDLFPEHNADFSTQHQNYHYRNILWLLKPNRIWALDTAETSPISRRLIYPGWVELPATEDWQEDVIAQYRQANTVQESYFQELGKGLGSVNYFRAGAFEKSADEDLLFLNCCL